MRASAAHVVPFANSRRTDAPELWPGPLSLHTIPFGQHNCLIDISASYLFTSFHFLHEKRSVRYGYSKQNCTKIVLMRNQCRFIWSPRIRKDEIIYINLCCVGIWNTFVKVQHWNSVSSEPKNYDSVFFIVRSKNLYYSSLIRFS